MSSFPNFSNIRDGIQEKLDNRVKGGTYEVSKLNSWVRLSSGTGPNGMVLLSNPNYSLFKAAGSSSTGIYGNSTQSGTIGTDWDGNPINSEDGQGYKPSPIVTSMEIDEGAGSLSRKASFTITAYSKEQMEILSQYFLEPGYSIFLEWGFNTEDGVSGLLESLESDEIKKYQSFTNTDKKRFEGGYEYDNYLGFITAGGLSLDSNKWNINVECTGYTELPSYLLTTQNGDNSTNGEQSINSAQPYGASEISSTDNVATQRWMRVFNQLPDTRKTKSVKNLGNELSKIENFIGFDDDVAENVNDQSNGYFFFGDESTLNIGGDDVKLPHGTKIISNNRFIKFSALMKIISTIGIDGYYFNGDESTLISFSISSDKTYCSAFDNMYSIDPNKLFIPNPKTPKFNLGKVTSESTVEDLRKDTNKDPADNSVERSKGESVKFPKQEDLNEPVELASNIKKDAGRYGKLDDLYVNFDFAKSVLETKNFFIKDAIYQILNGMSSAVNGMWDFQIIESEISTGDDSEDESGRFVRKNENKGTMGPYGTDKTNLISTELKICELNMVSDDDSGGEYMFDLVGTNSIFIDSSFDLDLGGAKMNQVIGRRLGSSLNQDATPISKNLFSTRKDKLGVTLKKSNESTNESETKNSNSESEEEIKEKNLEILLDNLFFYPKVKLKDNKTVKGDLYNYVYFGAYKNSTLFTSLKHNNMESDTTDKGKDESKKQISALMPINFSFSIHGISGIKRGDKFRVNGIPDKYKDGFFQVLSVKHGIDGMQWTTEVTGGYRQR